MVHALVFDPRCCRLVTHLILFCSEDTGKILRHLRDSDCRESKVEHR